MGGRQQVRASVFPCTRVVFSLALVLRCPSLLPSLPLLSLQLAASLAADRRSGHATPPRPACCERRVTEPDNTTNCSTLEEIKKTKAENACFG